MKDFCNFVGKKSSLYSFDEWKLGRNRFSIDSVNRNVYMVIFIFCLEVIPENYLQPINPPSVKLAAAKLRLPNKNISIDHISHPWAQNGMMMRKGALMYMKIMKSPFKYCTPTGMWREKEEFW